MHEAGRTIVFHHIPKSAGMSMTSSLAHVVGGPVVEGFDRSLFGWYDDFGGFEPGLRRLVHGSPEELPRGAALVAGHFALSTTVHHYPYAEHVTLLREGRSRLLSHWLYWRSMREEDLAGWGGWARVVRTGREPLADFLADPQIAMQVDNVVVRNLLWPHPLIPEDRPIDPRNDRVLLAEARAALSGFAFVGTVEDPRWEARFAQWLGAAFHLECLNETTDIPKELRGALADHLTAPVLHGLARLSRLDNQLWSEVSPTSSADAVFVSAVERHARVLSGVHPG